MGADERNRLIEALQRGDLSALRACIKQNQKLACSPQVVLEAARLGWVEAFDLLLRNGADPNVRWRGYRPLHALIQEEPHGKRGSLPAERVAALRWLFERGADPEQLGGWPSTRAIVTAAFVGEPKYVEEARRAGAKMDAFVSAALGNRSGVEKALAKEPDFALKRDPGGLTALHCCAGSRLGRANKRTRDSLLSIGALLLDAGADANARARGWSHELDVAYFAVSSRQRELFALLLKRGADPEAALPSAMWQGETGLVELTLAHGATLDGAKDGEKPLLNQMIRWGRISQALWMLNHGASPNVSDEQGWTAVHQAASRGNERVLKALLDAGGDRSRQDLLGRTPLAVAQEMRKTKMVALLGG